VDTKNDANFFKHRVFEYFRCEYPGCTNESDYGYEVMYKGKKIKVCETCYKTIKYPIRHKDVKRGG
jgi:ribosome-binding protein aMBF1 (putative translation factor)